MAVGAVIVAQGTAAADDAAQLRRECRAALDKGDESVAKQACKRAFLSAKTTEDILYNVAALVDMKAPPTMSELVEATYKADLAAKLEPGAPWGYAARCLIALRLGDPNLLGGCEADLKRVAPDHEQTRKILARAAHTEPSGAVLARWLLLFALVGTLLHALWNRRPPRKNDAPAGSVSSVLGLCLFALIGAFSAPAAALPLGTAMPSEHKGLSDIDVDEANPEKSIPSLEQQMKEPLQFGYLLQDLLAYAQKAADSGDFPAAQRYYLALAKAVPQRAYPFTKLCENSRAMGDPQQALAYCREAVVREGVTLETYQHLVDLLISKSPSLSRDDRKELQGIAEHVAAEKQDVGIGGQLLRCKVAVAVHDVEALESCTAALVKASATDSTTISFQYALALERSDFAGAKKAIASARQAGFTDDSLSKMEGTVVSLRRQWWVHLGLWIAGIGLALLALRAGARRFGFPRREQVPA
ncbi:MAG TPA: hypothetical protein VHL80_05160 [Polyangia bacterium]|nr:hypothetical protein [Polyangia bacterium]